jgi:hypothetical protein
MDPEGPLPATAPAEWIDVWPQADGLWRWRYRNVEERVDLLSNEGHPTLEHAVTAASTAYPGVPVIERRSVPGPRTHLGAAIRAAAVAALALLGLLVGMVTLPVVAVVKLRRLARRLRPPRD